MSRKKLYVSLVFLFCVCIVLSISDVSANTGAEVLIYTGKIAVTTPNEVLRTYTMPQELTTIPVNSTTECIDGIAILKIGEVQIILEATDKVKISSQQGTEKVNIVCLNGEIEAIWGEDMFKIANSQTLALSNHGTPIIETADSAETPVRIRVTRNKLAAEKLFDPSEEPAEWLHATPHF